MGQNAVGQRDFFPSQALYGFRWEQAGAGRRWTGSGGRYAVGWKRGRDGRSGGRSDGVEVLRAAWGEVPRARRRVLTPAASRSELWQAVLRLAASRSELFSGGAGGGKAGDIRSAIGAGEGSRRNLAGELLYRAVDRAAMT